MTRPFRHEAESRGLSFNIQVDPYVASNHHRQQALAAGVEEPAVQCVQVHRARWGAAEHQRGHRRLDRGSPGTGARADRGSLRGKPIPALASRPKSSASSSRRSSRPMLLPAANTVGLGWALRSAANFQTCSAARSSCAAGLASAVPSRFICRWSISVPQSRTVVGSVPASRSRRRWQLTDAGPADRASTGTGYGRPFMRSSRVTRCC